MKYLIKKTYTATDKNENFKGRTTVYYCGPDGASNKELDWYIKERAYSSKAGLFKALKSSNDLKDWEEKAGFWTIDLEVVEV